MDFEARVINFLGETTGTSKAGNPWKKKEWVVETMGQYPRKVKVQCFGERSDSLILENGKDYILSVDLESREFNGRWYTDVSVFRVQEIQGGGMGPQPGGYPVGYPSQQPQPPYPNQPYTNPAPQGGFGQPHQPDFGGSSEPGEEDLPF